MRPLLTREAVRAVDADAVERLGVPGIVLMENAGGGAARALLEHFEAPALVVLLGGPGQNGGDAWVVARHLHNQGVRVRCVLVGKREKVKGDADVNLRAIEALGIELRECGQPEAIEAALAGADVLVDGLFGTGLDRPIEGVFAQVVRAMDRAPAPVVALDLPSGVDSDTGAVLGVAARATLTVTFAALKRGLFQYPGAGLCGHVRCVSIGVPAPEDGSAFLIDPDSLGVLGRRPGDSHKGKAGHVLAVAGAAGTTGAALLVARGAFRAGAGLVTLAPRPAALSSLEQRVLEAMTVQLPEDPMAAAAHAVEVAGSMASAVVGPGLGRDEGGRVLARELAQRLAVPCVLDADALSAHAADLASLRRAAAARVLTPHPGEAGRLLGASTGEVQADRYAAARTMAHDSGHVVVLKGAGSVVAAPDGRLAVCERGSPAMGVAGTGDVLAGAVGACLAVAEPFEAAMAGVWLHARAGELISDTDRGVLASQVADSIPRALAEVQARSAM